MIRPRRYIFISHGIFVKSEVYVRKLCNRSHMYFNTSWRFLSYLLSLGKWRTCVWVHSKALPGLCIPRCSGTGDSCWHKHRPGEVLHLGPHDHCQELPGRLPLWQVECKGKGCVVEAWQEERKIVKKCEMSISKRALCVLGNPSVWTKLPVPALCYRDGGWTDESPAAAHWSRPHITHGETWNWYSTNTHGRLLVWCVCGAKQSQILNW